RLHGDAVATHLLVVGLPVHVVVVGGLGDYDLHVVTVADAHAHFLDLAFDNRQAADQQGLGDLLIHRRLHGEQHVVVLTLGIDDAGRVAARQLDDGLHEQAAAADVGVQLGAVGVQILDGPGGDTAGHG